MKKITPISFVLIAISLLNITPAVAQDIPPSTTANTYDLDPVQLNDGYAIRGIDTVVEAPKPNTLPYDYQASIDSLRSIISLMHDSINMLRDNLNIAWRERSQLRDSLLSVRRQCMFDKQNLQEEYNNRADSLAVALRGSLLHLNRNATDDDIAWSVLWLPLYFSYSEENVNLTKRIARLMGYDQRNNPFYNKYYVPSMRLLSDYGKYNDEVLKALKGACIVPATLSINNGDKPDWDRLYKDFENRLHHTEYWDSCMSKGGHSGVSPHIFYLELEINQAIDAMLKPYDNKLQYLQSILRNLGDKGDMD